MYCSILIFLKYHTAKKKIEAVKQDRRTVFVPEHHEVLHHFFAQVVIDTVDLILTEEGGEVCGQLLWALEVMSKRFLNNHSVPAPNQHTQEDDSTNWIIFGLFQTHQTLSDEFARVSTEASWYWLCAHAVLLDVLGDIVVDCRRQSQIKQPVSLWSSGQSQHVRIEFGERSVFCIFPADVRVSGEESRQPLCFHLCHLRQRTPKWMHL